MKKYKVEIELNQDMADRLLALCNIGDGYARDVMPKAWHIIPEIRRQALVDSRSTITSLDLFRAVRDAIQKAKPVDSDSPINLDAPLEDVHPIPASAGFSLAAQILVALVSRPDIAVNAYGNGERCIRLAKTLADGLIKLHEGEAL